MGILDRFTGDSSDSGETEDRPDGGKSKDVSKATSGVSDVSGDHMEYGDFVELLETCGHLYMFSRLMEEKVEEKNSNKSDVVEGMVGDISSNVHEFVGTFDVQDIAEDNGIDFQEDIVEEIPRKGM